MAREVWPWPDLGIHHCNPCPKFLSYRPADVALHPISWAVLHHPVRWDRAEVWGVSAPGRGRARVEDRVEGAANAETATVEYVSADHCRLCATLAEQLLYGPDVVTVLEQMRRKGVSERVACDSLRKTER